MKKPTKQQLIERIAELAVEHRHAHYAVTCLREDYKGEVFRYFRVHGEPYPNRHGIDYSDPAYDGVIRATAQSYERMSQAKQHRYNVKRRLDTAVRNLMDNTGDQLKRPAPAVVKRATLSGETLQ
ncbi:MULTISPECIES: hypothetical protein [Pseudomonas]|uniref:Uncharacterized protein n=1 Tax=Pseudomonas juntendi TaxID=2666183 RepID=A0A7W2PVF1_9PSED|nr:MULTISPECIES: hypothetical protein [Pseudomonas]MBA6062300.1 hypothetical protein [Pseudomonas juntendi]MBA6129846.1 hypothetical protein [Pseudomonas juntendi]MCE0881080.1 hypothetical protein [Pseudomonas putida]MDD2013072.1 hypothetical protein [Pseudomonas putida]HDS1780771.1 hypothetical protein [Pseudomonas putida]